LGGQGYWQGSVPACAAEDKLAPKDDSGDRVVDVPGDGAVVHQEEVGDPAQPLAGFVLVDADWLVGEIAACGDNREPRVRASANDAGACREVARRGWIARGNTVLSSEF